jgi:hypothetical protein
MVILSWHRSNRSPHLICIDYSPVWGIYTENINYVGRLNWITDHNGETVWFDSGPLTRTRNRR